MNLKKKLAARRAARRAMPLRLRAARDVSTVLSNAIMWIFSFTCVFPVIWLFYTTFKTNPEFNANVIALPKSLNLDNYIYVFSHSKILMYIGNSFLVTVVSVFFIVVLGFITGYFLGRFRFRGSKLMYSYYLMGMLIPVHSLMIPIYILFNKLNLIDRRFTLVLPYVAFGLPIALFLVASYIKSIPVEIEEAACIDGSSFTRTLFSIIMPLCKPILVTVMIIQFFACWNEFTFALTLTNSDALRTVPLGLTLLKGQYTQDYPRMMTSMLIAIIPAVVIYFSFSKQIIKGMVTGAVKG